MGLGCPTAEATRAMLAKGTFTGREIAAALLTTLGPYFSDHCLPTARAFLETDLDVNWQDNRGNTALIRASQLGSAGIVQALLQKGADIALRNKVGKTALDFADPRLIRNLIRQAAK